jgi:hypothetical protein
LRDVLDRLNPSQISGEFIDKLAELIFFGRQRDDSMDLREIGIRRGSSQQF